MLLVGWHGVTPGPLDQVADLIGGTADNVLLCGSQRDVTVQVLTKGLRFARNEQNYVPFIPLNLP